MKKTITYGQLENGMKVWIQGYLFEVCNLRRVTDKGFMHPKEEPKEVVRFEGKSVDPAADIHNTAYNGGTYGAVIDHPATIEIDDSCGVKIKTPRGTFNIHTVYSSMDEAKKDGWNYWFTFGSYAILNRDNTTGAVVEL